MVERHLEAKHVCELICLLLNFENSSKVVAKEWHDNYLKQFALSITHELQKCN